MTEDNLPSGAVRFDFLHGAWTVGHRRLAERLAGSCAWEEFGGTMECRPILAGLGNFDENVIDLPGGRYEACTLRLFDAVSDRWSIYWIDGRSPGLGEPMSGNFADDAGLFFGDDEHEGRPVRLRFHWTRLTTPSPRWEQAFSADGGASWEVNWTMEFTRTAKGDER